MKLLIPLLILYKLRYYILYYVFKQKVLGGCYTTDNRIIAKCMGHSCNGAIY